ncbi:kinase-like domain-containing protein [Rhizophagus clarus]|uniref:Kinase-like domain-containing protein n=1 Tax=Rhizophagus clarus TaxID=94130 RepID=A0A8H3KXZ2_9GLOM|nr:kinase-like domain-containing protein [Rhizophagus clarus]
MSYCNNQLINAAINKANKLVNFNIYNDIHKRYEFKKQTILSDESLTEKEKSEAIGLLTKTYDADKIRLNEGTKRICEDCNQKCLATAYCEHCIRNYLKANFSNWTSENDNVNNLIQECQMKVIAPHLIPEWIPYDNFQSIRYLTKGGCSEIYTAIWNDGHFIEWDSKKRQLKRIGNQWIVLKRLKNVENANQSWFQEAKSHLIISNKHSNVVQYYGLTRDPSNGNYMLVMQYMNKGLRKHLQQNHKQLKWKEKIQIAVDIIEALLRVHAEKAIHKDLHSGNILFKARFYISDLGFSGPADKPLKSIYGNLPYIAPEVIVEKKYTFKSDIYSIAMLMWEISSGQAPFINYEHNYNLAMDIVNGMRPKIVSGTPLEYENLMKICWDADPSKRLDINTLLEIDNFTSSNSSMFTSKLYQFENLPKPKNATKEELKAFYSRSPNFYNVDLSNQKNNTSEISRNNWKNSTSEISKSNQKNEEDIYNNPNLHSEAELIEFELPKDF